MATTTGLNVVDPRPDKDTAAVVSAMRIVEALRCRINLTTMTTVTTATVPHHHVRVAAEADLADHGALLGADKAATTADSASQTMEAVSEVRNRVELRRDTSSKF